MRFADVEVSLGQSCGLTLVETVICWGDDLHGTIIPPAGAMTAIAIGEEQLCGLRPNGLAECWGHSAQFENPPRVALKSVAAGPHHMCGLRSDQTIVCWGNKQPSQWAESPPPTGPMQAMALGDDFTCGLTVDEALACSGANAPVASRPGPFVSLSAFDGTVCGISAGDQLARCWDSEIDAAPVFSQPLERLGRRGPCAVGLSGEAACWIGAVSSGRGAARSVAATTVHACAVNAKDAVRCWFLDQPKAQALGLDCRLVTPGRPPKRC